MLKIGDKLICKLGTDWGNISYGSISYIKNNVYTVNSIENDIIATVYIGDENGEDWFYIGKDADYYIWDYFYTLKEFRKLKLKQLSDVKRR